MTHTLLFRRLILALQRARRENLKAEGKPAPVTKEQAGWSCRRFMKTAALAGAAGAVSGALPLPVRALTATGFEPTPKVAIVGGGIAGLNAAYQLKKAGIRATVCEGRRRVGGRILSVTGAIGKGLVTDLGGEFINSDHEDMLRLVQEFNLELFNCIEDAGRFAFPKTGYFFDGAVEGLGLAMKHFRPTAGSSRRPGSGGCSSKPVGPGAA
jgi:monoamine oxidase